MRLSLSKKELSEVHLMLTTLPIPPIPISVQIDTERMPDGDQKTAFHMATTSVVQDSLLADCIVNSHSVFAALSFFVKWSVTPNSSAEEHKEIQNKKDAALLRIISSVLDYNEASQARVDVDEDDTVLAIFIKASQEWINMYLPDTITITIAAAPENMTIGFEHDLHIAMAHYCYSQGVLYNSKDSALLCSVHDGLYNDYIAQSKLDAEDNDADPPCCSDGAPGPVVGQTNEHLDITEMYSKFPYHKMLLLCYNRLVTDCLYGHSHTSTGPQANPVQNARDLLDISFANYDAMMKNIPPHALSTQTPGEGPQHNTTVATANTVAVEPTAAPHCPADMGSYKSSVGIFVLGIVNFLQQDNLYFLQNMHTSLLHLHELRQNGNAKARLACQMVDTSKLVDLVRDNLGGLQPCDTVLQIQSLLLLLEQEPSPADGCACAVPLPLPEPED